MDNFIDRLAQKFTAGEVIRANSAAEERELKKLREQVAEYERCLQEMRKIQMTNTQSAQQLHDLMVESSESIHKLVKESLDKISGIQLETESQKAEANKSVEKATATVEEMETKVVEMQQTVANLITSLEKNQKEISDWFKQADEFLHKENVKVYRNVQAVIVDEVGNKADAIMKAQEETVKKSGKPVLIFAILGFVAAVAGLVVQILNIMGMFGV